jgi:outer membrane protein assembly factor BamB
MQEERGRPRRRLLAIAKTVGLRLLVLAGATLLVLFFLGDLRLSSLWPARRPVVTTQPEAALDPGWPHLRGPTHDAVSPETGLADAWPTKGPPVLWMRELGPGYSALIAVGGRVYTQDQDLAGQSVLCLDADSGQTIWEYRVGWPYEPGGMYPGPRSTPTWHDGRVYFTSPYGLAGCLGADDGRLLWSVDLKRQFGGRGFDFGYACSPLVDDGKVILPAGGKGASVVALHALDGSTIWASGDEPASYASPMPLVLGGRRYVAAFLQNTLALLDLKTGRIAWQHRSSRGYDEHSSQPLYQEPYLMVASPFHAGARTYRLESSGAAPAKGGQIEAVETWHNEKMSNDTASSVLVDGCVYGFDLRDPQARPHRPSRGEFRCLDLRTGQIRWSSAEPGHATVIAADGKLLMLNDQGQILLTRANPDRYEELGRAQIFSGEICWTAPALARGRLYLRSPTRAACVYVGKPQRLSAPQLAQARPAVEVAVARSLDWTWLVGGEREYPFDLPDARELRLWYGYSLLAGLAVPAAMAFLLQAVLRRLGNAWAIRASQMGFWTLAFLLSILATPLLGRLRGEFIFTWPLALLLVQQLTLMALIWSGRQGEGRKPRLVSLAAFFSLLTVCLAYFQLCRHLGLAPQWIFLLGFIPSWPLAVPAAYHSLRRPRLLVDVLGTLAAFTLYYASCWALITWRS